MDMNHNPYMALPGITPEEMGYLQQAIGDLNENQQKYFYMVYSGKRKNPQDIMLFTLLGFIVVAGVQRFVVGQIGMGILYLLTGGLCLIGTIVDLVNYKTIATDFNRKMAYESYQIAKMSS
ncbi:MAG TPA: TM2 domain-containing protein [Mucilaginibacter sp.]|jgi:TM2 domain-containing membrane protein YozV